MAAPGNFCHNNNVGLEYQILSFPRTLELKFLCALFQLLNVEHKFKLEKLLETNKIALNAGCLYVNRWSRWLHFALFLAAPWAGYISKCQSALYLSTWTQLKTNLNDTNVSWRPASEDLYTHFRVGQRIKLAEKTLDELGWHPGKALLSTRACWQFLWTLKNLKQNFLIFKMGPIMYVLPT